MYKVGDTFISEGIERVVTGYSSGYPVTVPVGQEHLIPKDINEEAFTALEEEVKTLKEKNEELEKTNEALKTDAKKIFEEDIERLQKENKELEAQATEIAGISAKETVREILLNIEWEKLSVKDITFIAALAQVETWEDATKAQLVNKVTEG